MSRTILPGNNSFSFLLDGIPQSKAIAAEVTPNERAVTLLTHFGPLTIEKAGTTIGATAFTEASDIADFYDALVAVAFE